ncbi:MAG: hypothetical protein D3923_13410, partial [Candidatus Electrothrix sp. AR3]|nr:hypothetical protein [Candidatus Electrothrix sp. AR3]
MLATLLVVITSITVFIMFEMTRKGKKNHKKNIWRIAHRIFNYLLLILFTTLLVVMIIKERLFLNQFPINNIGYIILIMLLVSLIMINIIAKFNAQISIKFFLIGMVICEFFFALTGMTAMYNISHSTNNTVNNLSKIAQIKQGKKILDKKCNKCHSLERIYITYKTTIAWQEAVDRMAEFDAPNIIDSDITLVVSYLIDQQKRRAKDNKQLKVDIGKNLTVQKCKICHSLDRIFSVKKSAEEWRTTVNNMAKIIGIP